MTPDPFQLIHGHDFDATASNIQVRADRYGAKVFDVQDSAYPDATVRVLAHTAEDAKVAARAFLEEMEAQP